MSNTMDEFDSINPSIHPSICDMIDTQAHVNVTPHQHVLHDFCCYDKQNSILINLVAAFNSNTKIAPIGEGYLHCPTMDRDVLVQEHSFKSCSIFKYISKWNGVPGLNQAAIQVKYITLLIQSEQRIATSFWPAILHVEFSTRQHAQLHATIFFITPPGEH